MNLNATTIRAGVVLLASLVLSPVAVAQGPGPSSDPGYDERTTATLAVENPGVLIGTAAVRAVEQELEAETGTQGFDFKDPIFTTRFSYRQDHDSSTPGGFDDDEYTGELGFDADIYDGLVAGILYQHSERMGHNSVGTHEDMHSDGFSLYLARRFFDLMNAGAAYNYVNTGHQLTGSTAADLDRTSNGFTVFAGVSDKLDDWYLAGTGSFVYLTDDYEAQPDLDTGLFTFAAEVTYDVNEIFTPGVVVRYNRYFIQDLLAGTPLDSDYWAYGPTFAFYPSDDLVVRVDLEAWQGYTGYEAYKAAVEVAYAF